jgi:hypothetical protein
MSVAHRFSDIVSFFFFFFKKYMSIQGDGDSTSLFKCLLYSN